MKLIPSALLRDAATAVERFEHADAKLRREYPSPDPETVEWWNGARNSAEIMLATIKANLR